MAKTNPALRVRRQKTLRVLQDFRIIYGSVRQHHKEIERICGVSDSQLWMLREVQRVPGIGISDLAMKLALHQSTCSQLVEKLVRSGHLSKTRSRQDQRRVGLEATKQGRETLSCAPRPTQGLLPEAVGELSPATLDALHHALRAIVDRLDVQIKEDPDKPLAGL